jgi:hypothetical protein
VGMGFGRYVGEHVDEIPNIFELHRSRDLVDRFPSFSDRSSPELAPYFFNILKLRFSMDQRQIHPLPNAQPISTVITRHPLLKD